MSRKTQILALLATLCTGVAFAASPVAYVYVQNGSVNAQGNLVYSISVYSAASDGKLTLVKGSPFLNNSTDGIVGTNGSYLVTQGNGYVYSYAVESSGDIGKLVSKINTQLYSGDQCGTDQLATGNAELDHTGKYVYIILNSSGAIEQSESCAALQTYKISSAGELTFEGSTVLPDFFTYLPAVTGNNEFAEGYSQCCYFQAFSRESSTGVLNVISSSESDPPGYEIIYPPTPDPTDHLAVVVQSIAGRDYHLASYTVNSHGDTISTNTGENMPSLDSWYALKLDPTGKYLAVATGTGVQVFYFNGAKPISKFTGIVGTSGFIASVSWDGSGHLYANNGDSGKLHVYDGKTKSLTEAPGSPYHVCGVNTCTVIVRIP